MEQETVKLSLQGITKYFGKVRALSDVNLEVSDGEFCVLLGPSGCGKSTLLRIIAGLEDPTEGRVFIGKDDVTLWSPKERDVAMVFQSYALYPHMDVYHNMAFALKIRGVSRGEIRERVERAADFLEIKNILKRRPSQLSGGQKQRVAIGRAIVRKPKLFLFDEPLSNLDAVLRGSMRVELARLHKRLRTTMIYVTHDQIEAMTLGEKIVVMDAGVIQQIGSPQDIYNRPVNLFVASFVGTPTINLIEGEVCRDRGKVFLHSNGLKIEVGEKLASFSGKSVVLGIRPEDIILEPQGASVLRAIVDIIENTGSEKLIYLNLGRFRIIIKSVPSASWREGDSVSLRINMKKAHFFYKKNRIDMEL